jgi:hypothetical protein
LALTAAFVNSLVVVFLRHENVLTQGQNSAQLVIRLILQEHHPAGLFPKPDLRAATS